MSWFKEVREMDRKFSWSFFSFMLAIVFGSITVYIEFFKENKPDLNFIITANTSVLDIREKLGSLDVLYHGESLSKNKNDLRLITFEVVNQGDTPILSNFYDKNDPVGFSVVDGKIADEPILIKASNKYLERKLQIIKESDNSVLFSNVILEPKEFFKIKLLVLHELSKNPTITPFGKIAGVNKIDIFSDYSSSSKESFISKTFGGNIYTTLARLFAYGFVFIFILVDIIIMGEKLSDAKEKRRKNKLVEIFKEYKSDKISEKDSYFFDYYLINSPGIIKRMHNLLSNQEKLNEYAKEKPTVRDEKRLNYYSVDDDSLFAELLSEGFIDIDNENNTVTVDQARYTVLTNFYHFLKRKGETKNLDEYIHRDSRHTLKSEDAVDEEVDEKV